MEQIGARFRHMVSDLTSGMQATHRLSATRWFGRDDGSSAWSTNRSGLELPFQRWFRFKEAFAPRAVVDAIASLPSRPRTCIDPFGGSGTTALTCQFLGVRPTTIEVNPFLADLIEAKLCRYDVSALIRDYRIVLDAAASMSPDPSMAGLPPTFVEPGMGGRWIFGRGVCARILALRNAIDAIENRAHARLMRVLLGSCLVGCSNITISGKGRRYRSGWESRAIPTHAVTTAFEAAFLQAVDDICRHGDRPCSEYTLVRGDAREFVGRTGPADFALFSPPYPNSFDYTDVYNVELWVLGYLRDRQGNRALRESTLRSHVQVKRCYRSEASSPLLQATINRLVACRSALWDADIPEMISAYFGDLEVILEGLRGNMLPGASVMMVVGDSSYGGVTVDVAAIAAEMAVMRGYDLVSLSPVRSMRASPQQGGQHGLGEVLVHLARK